MSLDDYKVVLYRNQPDGWVAEVPSVPGCYALMNTRAEARSELERVFAMIEAEYLHMGYGVIRGLQIFPGSVQPPWRSVND
jgi:predicted RNase H-like HicB family nuclease